jgi:uracil-DNA glycosylase
MMCGDSPASSLVLNGYKTTTCGMTDSADRLCTEIRACTLCAVRFSQTATAHTPRPVPWFSEGARILIVGQAPGLRVHASGQPFSDASGQRLRDWLRLDDATFYDRTRVAIVPMAFCFPGYNAKGADLPPPPICAVTWRARVMAVLPQVRLTVLVGGSAIRWHLGAGRVADMVRDWQGPARRGIYPLPHPSWRNTGWLNRNPWFTDQVLPDLRTAVADALRGDDP